MKHLCLYAKKLKKNLYVYSYTASSVFLTIINPVDIQLNLKILINNLTVIIKGNT